MPSCYLFNVVFLTGEEPEDSDLDLPKVYEPMESFESLKERLNMFLSLYNESIRGASMDMVFFQDAMIHLIKVLLHWYDTLRTNSEAQVSNSPLTYTTQLMYTVFWFFFVAVVAKVVVDTGFVCVGVKDNPDTWRECFVGGCRGFRQTEPDQTGLVHGWIQHLPDYTFTVMRAHCLSFISRTQFYCQQVVFPRPQNISCRLKDSSK